MPATKDCLFEYQNISFNKTIETEDSIERL